MQPKYIEALLKSAAFRKRDYERQVDRKVHREREKEGDEFDDKDAFVTGAYPTFNLLAALLFLLTV